MAGVKRFGVSIEADLLRRFDKFAGDLGYANRSEAFRDLIREKLLARDFDLGLAAGKGEVTAVVSLVYDHHALDVPRRLTEAQHDRRNVVISTLHVHLSRHDCLEVLILRGGAKQVKALGDRLVSLRGVRHGRVTVASTGTGKNRGRAT
ncbi:MAG: nickel-responsive transcriptional regulator NikR [Planctomycetota bacterium]